MGTSERPADAATVLFGRTRRRILGWLLGHADETFYLRQIVRSTGSALGAAQRELGQLTAAGLVRRTVQGRQVYFQANAEAPIFPELRSLFAKTAGLTDVLRGALGEERLADKTPDQPKRNPRPPAGRRTRPRRQRR